MSTRAALALWAEELNGHIGHAAALHDATNVLAERYQGMASELDGAGQDGDARRVGEIRDALVAAAAWLDHTMTSIRAAIDASDQAITHLSA